MEGEDEKAQSAKRCWTLELPGLHVLFVHILREWFKLIIRLFSGF